MVHIRSELISEHPGKTPGASVDLQPSPRTAVGCLLQRSRPDSTTCDGILCFDTVAHCSFLVRNLCVLSLQGYNAVSACFCTVKRPHTGNDGFILCFDTLLGTRGSECIAMLGQMQVCMSV